MNAGGIRNGTCPEKGKMRPVIYEFDEIQRSTYNRYQDYILQFVQNRKLTGICHSHDFYEIVIIMNGYCTSMINGVKYELDTDTLIVFRPGDYHYFLRQSKDISIISLSVRKSEFEKLSDVYDANLKEELCRGELPIILSMSGIHVNISIRNSEIFEECQEYDCKLFLAHLMRLYIERTDKSNSELPKKFVHALREMQKPENLREGIPALERLTGYSRSQLTRLMKRHFSKTPHEYILNLRLSTAYNKLILTSEGIEEISEKLGYESFSHFNKIFKSKFGITPAMLRKQHSLQTI